MKKTLYEFIVVEWVGSEEGNLVLEHTQHYHRNDDEAWGKAQEIFKRFYDVDLKGIQTGTPVAVMIRRDGRVVSMAIPLAKAALVRRADQ